MEIKKIPLLHTGGLKKMSIASGPVIVENNKVLLVRGKGGIDFKFPGGYVKDNENFQETAIRESKEEVTCEIETYGEPAFYFLHNSAEDLDIVLIHYLARIVKGTPIASTEIEEFMWFDLTIMPRNLMENVAPVLKVLLG